MARATSQCPHYPLLHMLFSFSDLTGRSQGTAEACLTGKAEICVGTCQSPAVVGGAGIEVAF